MSGLLSAGGGKVFPLAGNQLGAAEPADNVWLSASAGTGKTQVLSARVLRLLLRGDVDPGQILCLTFTKAGAAEMANRINAVLARWVRMEPGKLGKELSALGADIGPKTQARARTLFARVLDCPGGGLRIDTIHAFSQWLLSNFPVEADLPPGARPMEDRERELLAREVLGDVLVEAERAGDTALLYAINLLTTRKDPAAVNSWLMRSVSAQGMWTGKQAWQRPMGARVNRLLDMPADADEVWAFEGLHPDIFPDDTVAAMAGPLRDWGTKTADKCLDFIGKWLGADEAGRRELYPRFRGTLLKADGTPSLTLKKPREGSPGFAEGQELIADAVAQIEERRALLSLSQLLTAAFELGGAFARKWEAAKTREGLIDFDDLIRKAADLLKNKDTSDWIRYKLDRQFNHILIDEAQDTNEAQWDIVFALIDDFFSGEGAAGDALRTIFTVGDYKQAIFGFQGTSPENFAKAKAKVARQIENAAQSAQSLRGNSEGPTFRPLDLGQSFRTSDIVLDFVNHAIEAVGYAEFGLPKPPEPHEGADRPGLVTLWNPVTARTADDDDSSSAEEERDWLPSHETELAERIAEQVRRWVSGEEPYVLAKGTHRHAEAGDIMVLVRKRRELAGQIVAKLHEKRVAVAGVDRLRLGAPLAVKDLMAALRFAAQPLDDLSLANLLASPLIGWSQDDLLEWVPRPYEMRLWDHLRSSEVPEIAEAAEKLRELLRLADYQTPQALLSWLLVGPWQSRAKLTARLGREANDPIDELVNAAFAYEATQTPSLAGFIQWFDAGSAELKRDADSAAGQVRVMTVHGSKGLQAPIVILADAAGAPGDSGDLELEETPIGGGKGQTIPLPPVTAKEMAGPLSAAREQAAAEQMQEHWRLMYVAMTRAEEALFIGGSLGPRDAKKGEPHEDSWYARLEPVFDELGDEYRELADDLWGARREWGYRAEPLVPDVAAGTLAAQTLTLPKWATTPIGPEPRPPRPLAPSNAGEDLGADPPLSAEIDAGTLQAAAQRGVLIHRLLERLPDIAADKRAQAGDAWLTRQGRDLDESARRDILDSALGVLAKQAFAALFAPGTLAEVPLVATAGGTVISGTIDRLLVTETEVFVADYKTTRRPPASLEAIPAAALRQMAAYTAALEVIYPGRAIRAGLLYTQAPALFEIPPAMLEPHKKALGKAQESFLPPHIE